MRLEPAWAARVAVDGRRHDFCIVCRAETVARAPADPSSDRDAGWTCSTCGRTSDRALVIDPGVRWWLAGDGEYWHESAGVFVRDPSGRVLLFERSAYPFALTVPAGHVDAGEVPAVAAARELAEEVGIRVAADRLRPVAVRDVVGDVCSRGADVHRWSAYVLDHPGGPVEVLEEGFAPVWLTAAEALERTLTAPVRQLVGIALRS